MAKCSGHVHTPEGKPVQCGAELRNVGFIKGDGDEIEERYVCLVEGCSRYKDNHGLPTKGDK